MLSVNTSLENDCHRYFSNVLSRTHNIKLKVTTEVNIGERKPIYFEGKPFCIIDLTLWDQGIRFQRFNCSVFPEHTMCNSPASPMTGLGGRRACGDYTHTLLHIHICQTEKHFSANAFSTIICSEVTPFATVLQSKLRSFPKTNLLSVYINKNLKPCYASFSPNSFCVLFVCDTFVSLLS
jgi:hypothetical protein